jgi:hypothetical protein
MSVRGCFVGIAGLFQRLFTGSAQPDESLSAFVKALHTSQVAARNELEEVRDEVERLKAAFNSFRGRVYAWKGRELPPEAPEKPAELPLSDPRVSKAELRARLLKPGKPFKHN